MTIKLPYLMAVTFAALGVFYITTTQGLSAAPSTTIHSLDATQYDLAVSGKTRLISFYSPDCPISKRDAANLNALHNQFTEQPVEVVAVAMSYDSREAIDAFSEIRQIEYEVAHDTDGSIAAAFPGVRFTPTTFLIDENGNIVWKHTGSMPLSQVSAQVSSLLSDPQIAALSR